MSWLISLVAAGLMFTSKGNLSAAANYNFTESKPSVEKTNNFDETERFAQTYPLSANGRVSVSNVNGSISVDVWDRSEVKLEYVKTADTKENLAEVEIKIDARQDTFRVETDYGDGRRRNSGERRNYGKLQVEYRLTVPRNAVLDAIETVNGSVSITGGGSLTKASSVNGQVRATNLRGTANLSTVNGTVEADFDQLQTGSRISLNTVNGTVNLVIPSNADATVKADTVNGNIVNDFGLPVRKGEYVGRDLYGRIGSGDVQIRLNSVNGTLSVKRKNDGKNVNPATNLLTTRNADNWNDGDNSESNPGARPPRPPRPPRSPRPPRNSEINNDEINKLIEQALKNAEKEVEKIKPELDKIYKEGLKQAANVNSAEMQAQLKEVLAQMSVVNWSGAPSIEEKSNSFVVKGIPKVTVEARNCDVSVRGWDKPEVRYSVTRFSKLPNQTPLDLQATQNGSDVNIKFADDHSNTKNDNGNAPNKYFFNEMNRLRIEVFVPRKSNLKIITSGEVRLENVSGDIDLKGQDESINVRDADGKLTIETSDGKIRVIGYKGEINTKTSGGATSLEGDFRGLSAQTINGTITLTLPENANANIESNRKDIVGEGVSLVYQGDGKSTSTWKIGSGGENHLLYTTAAGRVIVRSAKQLQN
ncbi:MAG TPA: DUF4097 family beta strand repeat-containing protein [Pyrinomonadaceae bacterium]|nr:DUF4097 family beta strand repeat-containing protein [Pyrinomonadaceae bacterium]